jgi:hypothetical protein
MSYFDDASLVMIPSGYKTSKVYSVKPTDGSGDLTFSRSNDTATRVGPTGLIEKVRTNLVLQSETFSNASWVKNVSTFSGDTLTAGAGTVSKGVYQVQTTQGVQVNYFDVAYVDHQWVQILVGTTGSDLGYANFDIQNKVVGSFTGIISASIQDFGTYVRIIYAINTTNKASTFIIFVDSGSAGRAASTSSTGSFKLLRAQVATGDIATDYIATTTAAVSVGPVANVPRLDYLNSSCPRLLLEPQRTNLLNYSEQFNNAYWELGPAATITANTILGPDGTLSADTLTANGTGGLYVRNNVYSGTAQTCSSSIFAKKANHSLVGLRNSGTNSAHDVFNFDTKTWTNNSGATLSYEELGNGWFRLKSTNTDAVNLNYYWSVIPAVNTSGSENTTASNLSVYIWGGQAEQNASYATSYIPTLGAAVTRGVDAASKTGISSLIGQTEGTIYFEVDVLNGAGIQVGNSTSANDYVNSIQIAISPSATNAGAHAGGVSQFNSASAGRTGMQKIAVAYGLNNYALYINGTQIATDSSATVPAVSAIIFNHVDLGTTNGKVAQTLLFKTRLTNAQLAELTTI